MEILWNVISALGSLLWHVAGAACLFEAAMTDRLPPWRYWVCAVVLVLVAPLLLLATGMVSVPEVQP